MATVTEMLIRALEMEQTAAPAMLVKQSVAAEQLAVSNDGGTVRLDQIETKPRKNTRRPTATTLEGIKAEIAPGKSIRLYGARYGRVINKTFQIGDMAEYDSFDLSYKGPKMRSYYGPIKRITADGVTVAEKQYGPPNLPPKFRRMSIYKFAARNWNFDVNEAELCNNENTIYV